MTPGPTSPLPAPAALTERLDVLVGSLLRPEDPQGVRALFATRSFIQLGGNSLLAMRLVAHIEDEVSLVVPIEELLSSDPLRTVLDRFPTLADSSPQPAGVEADAGTIAASPGQRGIWTAQRLVGGSMYSLVFVAFITGPLDVGVLEDAIGRTVQRHDGLRSGFRPGRYDLERYVTRSWRPSLGRVSTSCTRSFNQEVHAIATGQGRRPFDLDAGPPLRLLLVTNTPESNALVLVVHHMLLDAWAISLTLREMFTHYDALVCGDTPSLGPTPGLESLLRRRQRLRDNGELDRQVVFWSRRLEGVPTVLDLPADRPRPAHQNPAGARLPFDLGPRRTRAICTQAAALGVTPFACILAAFGLLLARYTGQRRLLVGVPVAGRPGVEFEHLIAHCATVVPVVIEIREDMTSAGYARAVQRCLADSLAHADISLHEMAQRFGSITDLSRNPLVHVVCGMYDQVVKWRLRAGPLTVAVEEAHAGGAPMDLTLAVQRSEPAFSGILEFATAVWSHAEADGFLQDFVTITDEMVNADTLVADIRGVTPQRRLLLDRLNDTARPYPSTSIEQLFLERARRTPDAVALHEGGRSLSYRELAYAATVQACKLREAGVRQGDLVAVGVDRSIAEVVAVLGALHAGAGYLALDESLPPQRTEQMIRAARPSAAIVGPLLENRCAASGVALVPSWQPRWATEPLGRVPEGAVDPEGIAYVAFTSGSTGTPKGVRVPHRGVIRLVHEAEWLRLGPGTRFLRFAPLSFDPSTLEIWGPLLTGGAIEIHPPGVPSPAELGRFIVERGVTAAFLMTGLFRLLAEFTPSSFAGLEQLVTGGEVLPPYLVARVLSRNPGLLITNGYGPTENTLFTTVQQILTLDAVKDPLPIGVPVSNTRVYVLDDQHRLLPPGAIGELYAAGDGLAAGYLDAEETAQRFGHFSPDVAERLYRTGDLARIDSSGLVQFLGRRDDQVKVRGFRVEPEEVRRSLCAVPGVEDAVVIATDAFGPNTELIAACVVRADSRVSSDNLENHLSKVLPRYMVPSRWVLVRQIPLSANGKVDRAALVAAADPVRSSRPGGRTGGVAS